MELSLSNFFNCEKMIKPDQQIGAIPPSKQIYQNTINLAWPSAVERVLVSLVGAMDTMMVGILGAEAIAAVGITQQPTFILPAPIQLKIGLAKINPIQAKRAERIPTKIID